MMEVACDGMGINCSWSVSWIWRVSSSCKFLNFNSTYVYVNKYSTISCFEIFYKWYHSWLSFGNEFFLCNIHFLDLFMVVHVQPIIWTASWYSIVWMNTLFLSIPQQSDCSQFFSTIGPQSLFGIPKSSKLWKPSLFVFFPL